MHYFDFAAVLLQRGQKCGQSNNFWENYEEDIARVVSLNASVFRLSLGEADLPCCCNSLLNSCSNGALRMFACIQGCVSAESSLNRFTVFPRMRDRSTGDQGSRPSLALMCSCACRVAQN